MPKLLFFNMTIATLSNNTGTLILRPVSREEAIEILATFKEEDRVSAIGHKASADALSALLNREIEENRIPAVMRPGDKAIALKLRGRVPEGAILDLPAMEAIGYDLVLMTAGTQAEIWRAQQTAILGDEDGFDGVFDEGTAPLPEGNEVEPGDEYRLLPPGALVDWAENGNCRVFFADGSWSSFYYVD